MNMVIEDELQALLLLSSLSDSWETLVVTMSNSAPDGKLSMGQVSSSLFNEETRIKLASTNNAQALVSENRGRRKTGVTRDVGNPKEDHNLEESPLKKENVITVIVGIGAVCIRTSVGCTMTLRDVRHVPDLRLNLISGIALDREGYVNYFGNSIWKLTKGSLVVARERIEKPKSTVDIVVDLTHNTPPLEHVEDGGEVQEEPVRDETPLMTDDMLESDNEVEMPEEETVEQREQPHQQELVEPQVRKSTREHRPSTKYSSFGAYSPKYKVGPNFTTSSYPHTTLLAVAMSHGISVSAHLSIVPNDIPQAGNTKLTDSPVSTQTTYKWSTPQDLALVSDTSKQQKYMTGYCNFTDGFHIEHARKLKEVRHLFSKVGDDDPLQGLIMIDAIQRLGFDYYFQEEIEAVLQRQYMAISDTHFDKNDLYEVSLRFRLLRQEGHNVLADVFNIFRGKDGVFKEKLSTDIKGLMGLYEASHLSMEGEEILDEAANFSSRHLNAWVTNLGDHHQARIVRTTLQYPYHKSLARFTGKSFLRDFKGTNEWENLLRELANLDCQLLQSIHQKEMLQVSEWWKELGLAKQLKFARDQPLKWYMWSMVVFTDPSLSEQRIDLTKPISLVYIIDDIFDVYGTLDDLTLFTEAVNRWEFAAIEKLPDYMKICFKALYDITNEISNKVYREHGFNPIVSLQKTWASLCNAFLVEAKWFASGHWPTAEDYLKNGIVSSGVYVVLIHIFFLLGHGTTKETANLVNEITQGIISSVAKILRLWDDLGDAKDENQDGHDGSYIEYYMKEHQGLSVKVAKQHVNGMISDSWKCLNQGCISPNPLSASFIKACLNAARMVPLMYNYDDNHQLPLLQDHIKSMLFDGVSSQLGVQ
ncbi:hypothetical protein F0562_018949 [Nyssa sinensis]|uniref:Uncharacterized protein n=1 Tax=Nyssa sinensis TaxID=561372 RepID=A0A5J4ZAL9_9ASTE|nr:hypothetical protein F0562_018949 [Nyssa sinensis]